MCLKAIVQHHITGGNLKSSMIPRFLVAACKDYRCVCSVMAVVRERGRRNSL